MAVSSIRTVTLLVFLGTSILPASAQESKGIGVVTALTGRADLKRPQAPETPLRLRDHLFVRDVVDTRKESLARILLLGKATVTVRELSRFEILEETRPDGSERALINLAEGKLRVMVARRLMKPGDEVEIRTPNAVGGVRGTDGIFEVSTLPDGRPLTVITGISGEFDATLPTTPPFVARGKTWRRGWLFVAAADAVSDAGGPLRVAQGRGFSVTVGLQAQVTGPAGAQTLAQTVLTQSQLNQAIGLFQINVGATGRNEPPPAATDKVVTAAATTAESETLATGVTPAALVAARGTQPAVPEGVITPLTNASQPPPPLAALPALPSISSACLFNVAICTPPLGPPAGGLSPTSSPQLKH